MKKKFKLILGGVLALIVITVLILQGTKALEAKALKLEPRDIAKSFKEEGLVISAEDTPVYAALTGKITGIAVQEGQTVKAGDLLATLDSQALVYQLEQLRGQLSSIQAQQQLEMAAIDLARLEKLYEAGAISRKEYEDAKLKAESQYYPGQIAALEAQIKSVQYQVEQSSIKADQDGIVSQLDAKKGMLAAPGQLLMKLFNAGNYQVETYVLTEDVARMSIGQEVELIQDNKTGDVQFKGSIEGISPSAVEKISALGLKEQRVKVLIKPQIPQNLQLKPGFALDIRFTIDRQEGQLVVPKTALFPYQEGDGVWVLDGGKAKVRSVKKGFENDKEATITEGLKSGETILLNPQLAGLKEGARIKTVNN